MYHYMVSCFHKQKGAESMNTVQPIRDIKKISAMRNQLKARDEKYALMFSIGINTGLRVSDILELTAGDVEGDHITIIEQKTGKKKRFMVNDQTRKEIQKYVKSHNLSGDDYLIPSRKGINKPIGRVQAYRILNEAASAIGLEEIGTHTMRKTFGYHFYKRTHDVALLQDIFNHSAPSITLRYIGINDDTKDEALKHFCL